MTQDTHTDAAHELTWAEVEHETLGTVNVGGEYCAGEPARITSTAMFVMTGDPGSPGSPAEFVPVEVWMLDAKGVERDVWEALSDSVLDDLAKLAIAAIAKQDAEIF